MSTFAAQSAEHQQIGKQNKKYMRKAILSMMLAAVAICGWAANNETETKQMDSAEREQVQADAKTLKVKLDLVDFGDTVMVYSSDYDGETFIGKDGKFEFELQVNNVSQGMFLQPRLLRGDMDDPRVYFLPLVGGETVRVWDTDKERFDVDGTGFYADYHKVDLFNENAGKKVHFNAIKYREMKADKNIGKEELDKFYKEVYEPSYNTYQKELLDYVKAHTGQEAAVCLLNNIDDLDKMKETFQIFDASVREGRMKSLFDSWVKRKEERLKEEAEEMEAMKKQAAGLEAPVFTFNDIEGKPLSLTSLRGKYVILDFWGSWCVWCIKGFPQMKEYYAKYPGKFEILGMDCNDSESSWKAAVKKYELPWLQVYCPKESTILDDYGVNNFPTKIIIDPEGKIVKTIVGEDASFYTLLDELFSE